MLLCWYLDSYLVIGSNGFYIYFILTYTKMHKIKQITLLVRAHLYLPRSRKLTPPWPVLDYLKKNPIFAELISYEC